MKKYLFIATAFIALVSCSSDDFVGENNPAEESANGAIAFGFDLQNITRGAIAGDAAAKLLDYNFYVTGTKGEEAATSPSPTLVFDNYLVHYGENTAGTTTSNTANWEYVGVTPETSPYGNYDKLSNLNIQTIKYWDYSVPQYDFLAFSTGTFKAKKDKTNPGNDEIGVTAMKYGTALANSGVAYTFYLPSEDALSNTYISDITEVVQANFGKEVQLKFKSLGSKVRVALYETVPGYSVKNVQFYTVDGTTDFTGSKGTDAALIATAGIPTKGQINVIFPHVGNNNAGEKDYNMASATVTPGSGSATYKTFGALTNQLVAKQNYEAGDNNVFLGRTLPTASFAGNEANQFYLNVFPVSTPAPLTLRVDYTLVPIDGAAETIVVKGAKAVVPSTYTKWLPNYAYTYIFKISDNTNGWTGAADKPSGLFPITFDAVVTEATDATAEQTTITTVATPSITTYQQGHTYGTEEYSKTTKGKDNVVRKLYVQVMHNEGSPEAHPVGSTYAECPHPILSETTAFLYKINDADATEAKVMDALENRTTAIDADDVTGRNGITLTKNSNIEYVTTIVNGPDDNPITIASGHGNTAEIDIANNGVTTGTYAFVYDYTNGTKSTTTIYQPITVTGNLTVGTKYVTTTILDGINTETASNVTAEGETVSASFLYFSKTTNGTGTTTYSFVSVDGKTTLPAGLVKCPVGSLKEVGSNETVDASVAAFVFNVYTRNTGTYAVKVIKIVA